jgi:ribose transport system permease protein
MTVGLGSAGAVGWRHLIRRGFRLSARLALPQLGGVFILFAIGSSLIGGFSSTSSVLSMLVIASFLGIAASGQTLAILLGGIDLSIPSLIALGNVVTAALTGEGWSFWATALLILGLAAAIGLVNGLVSKSFSIHPLIVTLGIGAIVGGGLLVWTGGQATGSAPAWLSSFVAPNKHTGPIPVPPIVVLWGFLSIVVLVVLTRTRIGRQLYITASNELAARLSLVRTRRLWAGAYMMSAVLAAIAGIALAGFSSTGDLEIGSPYLFTTIAAVVVGGTSLLGARGGYGRVVFGVLLLTEAQTILVGEGLSQAAQQAVLGLVILIIVAAYGRERPLRELI